MKRLLYVFMALCLFASIASAATPGLRLHWEMDSADDFNLGQNVGGFAGRTYVTNSVTNFKTAGMTAAANVFFDPQHKALRISNSATSSKVMGLSGNTYGETPSTIFTNETQYTFSLWAKGDLTAVSINGYSFYVFWSDGNKFKCDLGFKYNQSAAFTAPGNAWAGGATGIWDPNNTARYVNPESWNMYTFTWDADNNHVASYVNGVLRGSWGDNDGNDIPALAAGATVTDFGFGDGYSWASPGGWYRNFRIWDEALDATEVADLVGDFFLKAQDPSPAYLSDFVTDANTIDLALSWQAGTYAASHDLYVGTDFDDVNDADNMSPEFVGNIADNSYDITVTSGSTYYWRVDEVNDIDIWKGDVWSFNVIGVPAPALLWEMDSADDFTVGDGTGGSSSGRLYVTNNASGYKYAGMTSTGGIQYDADEGAVYMNGVHPCKIYGMAPSNAIGEDPNLIFTSKTQYTFSLFAKADLSAVTGNGYAFYVKFSDGTRFKFDLGFLTTKAFVLSAPTAGAAQYHIWDPDPTYAANYVDPETWNMYTATWDADNDMVRLYVNGKLTVSAGAVLPAIPAGVTVADFGFGDGYGYSGPGGWFKDYRAYNEALNADQINFVMGDFLYLPKNPSPKNNATGVTLDGTVLTWDHGTGAVSQDVYFGENYNDVNNADLSSPTYKGQIAVDTFDPGSLELFKTYYWRVDQLDANGDLIIKGPVWQFSSIESIMVEDFESYDNQSNSINAVWAETGIYGDMQIALAQDPCLSPINSMYLRYQIPYDPYYAIAARSFSPAQDWTVNGVKILTIHCYGDAANFVLPVFVTIGDGTTDVNVVVDVNTLAAGWNEINVSLPPIATAGVDLTNITYMEIGFGNGTNVGMSDQKWNNLYIDDIALYPAKCVLSESSLLADITADCVVNYDDLAYITDHWLGTTSAEAIAAAGPVGLWLFDDPANLTKATIGSDLTTGIYNGTGGPLAAVAGWAAGDGAVMVPLNTYLIVDPNIVLVPGETRINEYTMVWDVNIPAASAYGIKRWVALCEFDVANLSTDVDISVIYSLGGGVPCDDGRFGTHQGWSPQLVKPDTWYQLAVSVSNGEFFNCYVNGELVISIPAEPVDGRYSIADTFHIFKDNDNEDPNINCSTFALFDRALTAVEIRSLLPIQLCKGDLNDDTAIDFADYAILANEWLVEDLWP